MTRAGLLKSKDSPQVTANLIRKWATGAYVRSPLKVHVGALSSLADVLCEFGWTDDDVRAFSKSLNEALCEVNDPPTVDALLKLHEAFLRWNALWKD